MFTEIISGTIAGVLAAFTIQGIRAFRIGGLRKIRVFELLRDYPSSFHLYIVGNHDYQDIASVCVIDADRKDNVVEFMLSAEKDLEDSTVRLASTTLFLHGRRDLVHAVKANLLAMKQFAIAKKCETEADVDAFLHRV